MSAPRTAWLKDLNGKQQGWVLIDGLIAAMIVAIALTALAMVYRQSTVVSVSAANYSHAVYLAQKTIENIKLNDLTDKAPEASDLSPVAPDIYRISITHPVVTEITNSDLISSTIVPIQVTVSWEESGSDRSVALTSYYVARLKAGSLQ